MSEWREQLKNNYSFGKKMISDLHEIIKYNPNLPLNSIVKAMQQRGHVRATAKNTKKYMDKDPLIFKKQDMRHFHNRPMVYYMEE
tara:strand:+ start:257 stop:511 length:255 start_codon:yes stop_codon:yes gene_type:complete